jgi:hypothetical protein
MRAGKAFSEIYFIDVQLKGARLTGEENLISVYLTNVHLIGVHLTTAYRLYLTGVYGGRYQKLLPPSYEPRMRKPRPR